MKKLTCALCLAWIPWLVLGPQASAAEPPSAASPVGDPWALEPCHIENLQREVLCGSYRVYEDRRAASGRQIEVRFAVIEAVDETSEPDPLVFFAGGPGQGALSMAPLAGSVFRKVLENRDIVLIDQRGMGTSSPLDCEEVDDDALMQLSEAEQEALARQLLTQCVDELDADVTLYTQDLANDDIHDILLGLGYSEINIYGGSWGTRSALLYAHRYPEQVRTMVLDGALPLSNTAPLHAAADADRAMQELFDDCSADAACKKAFPDLEASLQQAIDLLGDEGTQVEIVDATSGKTVDVTLTANRFGDVVRSILYIPSLSRTLPLIIERASVGDYRPMSGVFGFLASATGGSMTVGASLSIFCSEELARMDSVETVETVETVAPAQSSERLGSGMLANLQNACSVWPKAPLPEVYGEDVSSSAPTLVLSGEVDPITPPAWGETMLEALPNGLHLIAPFTGHNVAPVGCAPKLIHQLIEQGNLEGIDGSCLESLVRPSFFIDSSGPAAGPRGESQ